MPVSTEGAASVTRAGEVLRFGGALQRDEVAGLWPRALSQLAGVRRLDLTAVERVDSAGLALLAELAERVGTVAIDGAPARFAELRAAYRLGPHLGFATT